MLGLLELPERRFADSAAEVFDGVGAGARLRIALLLLQVEADRTRVVVGFHEGILLLGTVRVDAFAIDERLGRRVDIGRLHLARW